MPIYPLSHYRSIISVIIALIAGGIKNTSAPKAAFNLAANLPLGQVPRRIGGRSALIDAVSTRVPLLAFKRIGHRSEIAVGVGHKPTRPANCRCEDRERPRRTTVFTVREAVARDAYYVAVFH